MISDTYLRPGSGWPAEGWPAPVSREVLEEAACYGESAEVFFTIGMEEEAKKVCSGCTVRWDCLGYALQTRQRHGVWGGLTPFERILLIRKLSGRCS